MPTGRATTNESTSCPLPFGPTLPILPYGFDNLDSVVDHVNNDWSGLCSSVWSADPARAFAVAERLRTGTTWIN